MKLIFIGFAVLALMLALPAHATEEYADRTGEDCAVCHFDQGGGGALTPSGRAYADTGYRWPVELTEAQATAAAPSSGRRTLTLLLGLVHFLAGLLWIGTIFYVHLVLKPGYAKGGLPKKEVKLAWACIGLLLLTGVPLTILRYGGLGALLDTRSGTLLLVKIGLFAFLLLSAAFMTLIWSPRLQKLRAGWQQNDGMEGRPAWVKVGDLLYDVTESERWKEGNHFGRHQAGEDLTQALEGAPHGPEKLEAFRSFSLVGQALHKESTEVRVLFVMAYVNLAVAVGVVVVLATIRFG